MANPNVLSEFPYQSKYCDVLSSKMHYVEKGQGKPILFLHGFPASSYSWRNIIPYLAPLGRCIAVDLIGMGKSDKPDIPYTIADHIHYIEQFIETMQLKQVTLVMHGWGSIIGCDYAMRHEKNCRGLVFYESYIQPLDNEGLSLPYQEQLVALQAKHDAFANDPIRYVDKILAQSTLHSLSEEVKQAYRAPFLEKNAGKACHELIAELPRGHDITVVDQLIAVYSKKLMKSNLPKLLLYSIPGFITTIGAIMWAKEHLSHLEVVGVGEDLHFGQESNPRLMGEAISVWLQGVEQGTSA